MATSPGPMLAGSSQNPMSPNFGRRHVSPVVLGRHTTPSPHMGARQTMPSPGTGISGRQSAPILSSGRQTPPFPVSGRQRTTSPSLSYYATPPRTPTTPKSPPPTLPKPVRSPTGTGPRSPPSTSVRGSTTVRTSQHHTTVINATSPPQLVSPKFQPAPSVKPVTRTLEAAVNVRSPPNKAAMSGVKMRRPVLEKLDPSLHDLKEMESDMEDSNVTFLADGRCTCCPYGYHVDLDFLAYLDGSNGTYLRNLKKIHRKKKKVPTATLR